MIKPFSKEVLGTIEFLVSRREKRIIGFDPPFQTGLIYVKNYISNLAKLYKKLAEKKRSDVFGYFGATTRVFGERLRNSCLMASGLMRNSKAAMMSLLELKSLRQKSSTTYFRIPEIRISGEKYTNRCTGFFRKLEEEKSRLFKVAATILRNFHSGVNWLLQNFNLKIQELREIKTASLISIKSCLNVSIEEISIKNYIAGFKTFYRKLIEQKKHDITKSSEFVNRHFTNNLKYCHHLVTGLARKFKLPAGKLEDIKAKSPALMTGSVKDTLLFLYEKRPVTIMIDLALVLFIITIIVFYTKAKENAPSPFGISKPITKFSEFESRPILGVSFIDHKHFDEAFGETSAENLKQVSEDIKEDERPSSKGKRLKAMKRKMNAGNRKTELSKRELEEVLRGAFLIQ